MVETEGNGREKFLNKKVKIVFDDGSHVTIKFGVLVNFDDNFVFIRTSEGDQAIPNQRIVRIELNKNGYE